MHTLACDTGAYASPVSVASWPPPTLLMSNQEFYSVMVQINWTLKTQAVANMQVQ